MHRGFLLRIIGKPLATAGAMQNVVVVIEDAVFRDCVAISLPKGEARQDFSTIGSTHNLNGFNPLLSPKQGSRGGIFHDELH